MKLNVLAFGKLKTPGLREAADYYKRNVRPWVQLEEVELKPIPVSEKSPQIRLRIQEKEGTLLLNQLKSEPSGKHFIFLLDEAGKAKTTLAWANDLKKWETESVLSVSFCIGSSLGFSEEVRKRAHGLISLGPQTLPHELARVVLFEQLYRMYSVVRGHPYHNEGS